MKKPDLIGALAFLIEELQPTDPAKTDLSYPRGLMRLVVLLFQRPELYRDIANTVAKGGAAFLESQLKPFGGCGIDGFARLSKTGVAHLLRLLQVGMAEADIADIGVWYQDFLSYRVIAAPERMYRINRKHCYRHSILLDVSDKDWAALFGSVKRPRLDKGASLEGWIEKGAVCLIFIGHAQKESGSFYTSQSLAKEVVQRSMCDVKSSKLTICDPAMGCGAFLLAALSLHNGDKEQFALRCLFGVDRDPIAVEIARLSLWLLVGNVKLSPHFLAENLRVGDALLGCWRSRRGRFTPKIWKRESPDQKGTWVHQPAKKWHKKVLQQRKKNLNWTIHAETDKKEFDIWTALWFWPLDELESFPTSSQQAREDPRVDAIIREKRFFHWELEFPAIFARGGFDRILGNPPWEIQKPSSKSFFSAVDPLYMRYSKRKALQRQQGLFKRYPDLEKRWLARLADAYARGNFYKYAADSFPDDWPYRHQGSGDRNTYKLFTELGYAILRKEGRLSFIVPSGLYSDQGTSALRHRIFDSWYAVIGFENRKGMFNIHRSFKFCVIYVQKEVHTQTLSICFMQQEQKESYPFLSMSKQNIRRYAPQTLAIMELSDDREITVLERVYKGNVLLGDKGDGAWDIRYRSGFHLTNDARHFASKNDWKGYWEDALGCRWKGKNCALPLYNAKMFNLFSASTQGWVSGKGRSARWRALGFPSVLEPEYLMTLPVARTKRSAPHMRLVFKTISTAIHFRTMLCTLIPPYPIVNAAPSLEPKNPAYVAGLQAILGSFVFDSLVRRKMGYLNLNYFILADIPLPRKSERYWSRHSFLALSALRLCGTHPAFAFDWLKSSYAHGDRSWRSLWACSRRMRLELRVKIDAMVAALYGLRPDEFRFLLRDCDYPKEQMQDSNFCRTLEQKGFWRVDKEHEPELRHTVLSMIAFQDLYNRISHEGLDDACSFFAEHWSLPQYLQLSEYGLGHDERAQKKQPVAERLGEYLLDWQTEDPEESWKECRKWSDQIAVLFTGEQI